MKPFDVAGAVARCFPNLTDVADATVYLTMAWPALTRDPQLLDAFCEKIRTGDKAITEPELYQLALQHGREGNRVGIPWAWDECHRAVSRARGRA